MQSFSSFTYCKVSICFSFKGKLISSFSLAILISSSIFSWTIFVCDLSSGKQFKKNFYYLLTRLLEGQREWLSSYDWFLVVFLTFDKISLPYIIVRTIVDYYFKYVFPMCKYVYKSATSCTHLSRVGLLDTSCNQTIFNKIQNKQGLGNTLSPCKILNIYVYK